MRRPLARTLEIRTSPHLLGGWSVPRIMFNVAAALAPAALFAVWAFGVAAATVLLTATLSCLAAEHLACRAAGRPTTIGDGSAAVTGLLLGLSLPPSLPLWMAAFGGSVAILVGKLLFGGLGRNPFNPALVARAILQATFPVPMTTWLAPFAADRFSALPGSLLAPPFLQPTADAATAATPLALWKFERVATATGDLAFGRIGGSAGETGAILLLAGAAYLVARNLMSWRIPLAILATVAAASGALHLADPARHASPAFMLLSGGLLLGALFMATDTVTAPVSRAGGWVYGVLIGVLIVVIRSWAGMAEGVMYAILIGNAVAPHLDVLLAPRVFGTRRRGAAA